MSQQSQPLVIRKLDEVVVNRIAAGEVIQRPASALKEMIENCLDAKSSNIQISVKAGGLKFMQIQDNGTGIRREDMEIVCERFTTSKLQRFEDLQNIATYGFRGEALASISHIARLTILTKTSDSKCAYKASYEDGKLKTPPKPCAGNQGTQITVEDLFYNVSTRIHAFKSPAEEYQRISDVVSRYAVHNAKVGFSLKKVGENNGIKTLPNSTCVDNIRTLFGNNIANQLVSISVNDSAYNFSATGYITNLNYSAKKSTYLIFINHRLVDSSTIRKCLDQVYSLYLPKNTHPFIYLSLEIDPRSVDVNVHPTKHEVHFLHEYEIVEKIKSSVESKLLECNKSRTFYTQARLPGAILPEKSNTNLEETVKKYDKDMVRNSHADQSVKKFFGTRTHKEKPTENHAKEDSKQEIVTSSSVNEIMKSFHASTTDRKRVETKLTSVLTLRKLIEEDCHIHLREVLSALIFVGTVDWRISLFQYDTKLYLSNTQKLCEALFYEILLYDFENFGVFNLSESLSIRELAMLALDSPESGWTPEDGDKNELADRITELLQEKSPILSEYFAMNINSEGYLHTLPMILVNYIPDMGQLPIYILRLSTEVNWDDEQECFHTYCLETARFYALSLQYMPKDVCEWTIEHVIFPAIRQYLLPPKSFADNGSILQIASLPDLYKVFERC